MQHDSAVVLRTQRLPTPCAHRLGERTKRRRLGRVTVTPRSDSIASWAVEPVSQSLDPTSLVNGFSAHESSGPHAPFTNSTFGLDNGRVCYRRSVTEGPALAFRPLPARSTLVAPENDRLPRSGRLAFSHARLRASFGLAASPRSRRQDASNSLLQPTFRATSTHDKHHLRRLPIEHCGKPASVRSRDRLLDRARSWRSRFSSGDAGPPCGHPDLQRLRV